MGPTSGADMVKRVDAEGHMVGVHDTDHINLKTVSAADVTSRMTTMKLQIKAVIGKTPRYMRCPHGLFDDDVSSVLATQNLRNTHWTMAPADWERPSSAEILRSVEKFLNTVTTSSPGSIILLHDVYDEAAAAVSPIIDTIRAKGLKLVTVAECMNDKNGAYII